MKINKRVVSLFIIFILFIFLLISCGQQDNRLVARVGGRKITAKEFENKFSKGKKTKQVKSASLEEKEKFLDRMVLEKLKLIDAYQHNLDKDEKILNAIEERVKGLLFRHLIDKEVIEKKIPDSMVKDYYNKASREIKIRQIVLKFDNKSPEKKNDIIKKAKKIVQKLRDGEDFASLAKEESDDASTSKQGGKKGYLKWGPRSSENPVYVAAFSIKKDEISDPIETEDGYFIIKVIHIKRHPVPPFEQEKERIKQSIFRIFNKEIELAYYDYLDVLRKKYRMKFNEQNIELFVKRINSSEDDEEQDKKTISPFDRFNEQDKNNILVDFNYTEITINDLVGEIKKAPAHRRPFFRKTEDVKGFVNKRIAPIYLLEKEIEVKNVKNDKVIKSQIKAFMEKRMIGSINRTQVTDKIKINEENIKEYFEENREDYKHPPMREAQEIYVKDKDLADKIVQQAQRGKNFDTLFRKYNEKATLKKNKGKLGFMSKGRAGIGNPAFKIEVGGVTDPIRIGNGYSIVKVLSEKPESLKIYEEAKRIASTKLRRKLTTEQEKKWYDELRSKIDIIVYENNLENACKKFVGSDVFLVD